MEGDFENERQQRRHRHQNQHDFFNDTCGICRREIDDDQPKAEFMCFHCVHTQCIFYELQNNNVNVFVCRDCEIDNAPIVQQEQQEQQEQQQEQHEEPIYQEEERQRQGPLELREEIEQTFSSNPEFRKDIKKIITSLTEFNKKQRELRTVVKEKKLSIRAEVQLIRNSLTQVQRRARDDITSGEIFKQANKAHRRLTMLKSNLARKYDYPFSEIRRVVGRKHGYRRFRTLHRYYRTPGRMLFWMLYFRIRL